MLNTLNTKSTQSSNARTGAIFGQIGSELRSSLQTGLKDTIATRISSAHGCLRQFQNVATPQQCAELCLVLAEAQYAMGDLSAVDLLTKRIMSIQGGLPGDLLGATQRLRTRYYLDRDEIESAQTIVSEIDRVVYVRNTSLGSVDPGSLVSDDESGISVATRLLLAEVALAKADRRSAEEEVQKALLLMESYGVRNDDDSRSIILLAAILGLRAVRPVADLVAVKILDESISVVVSSRWQALFGDWNGHDPLLGINFNEAKRWNGFGSLCGRPQIENIAPIGSIAETMVTETTQVASNGSSSPSIESFGKLILDINGAGTMDDICAALANGFESSRVEVLCSGQVVASNGVGYDTMISDSHPQFEQSSPGYEIRVWLGRGSDVSAESETQIKACLATASSRINSLPALYVSEEADPLPADGVVMDSAKTFKVFAMARDIVRASEKRDGLPSPILIIGETGTGKDVLAEAIHKYRDSNGSFISESVAAIPTTQVEVTIFGAAKGAYTDAKDSRIGLIEKAERGTFFLDEIGELSLEDQAALLRVTQSGEYRRLGDSVPRRADCLFVFATNQDVNDPSKFRPDLKYRCQLIHIPPLRERREDIRGLALLFANRVGCSLGESALRWLEGQMWPGNIRELKHVIERAITSGQGVITVASLLEAQGHLQSSSFSNLVSADESYEVQKTRFEAALVTKAMAEADGKVSVAAERLGISRQGLEKMMRRAGVVSTR